MKEKIVLIACLGLMTSSLINPASAQNKAAVSKAKAAAIVKGEDKTAKGIGEITTLPGSSVKIDGDSTLRKFSSAANDFEIKAKAKEGSQQNGNLPWTPEMVEINIPVAKLNSGEGKLDEHMSEHLKAEQFPNITLKLDSFSSEGGKVTAAGTMTVAGVTKPITLEPEVKVEGQKITFSGKKNLLMSDFGIKPPTMMMGAMKTKDAITITYNAAFIPRNAQNTEVK